MEIITYMNVCIFYDQCMRKPVTPSLCFFYCMFSIRTVIFRLIEILLMPKFRLGYFSLNHDSYHVKLGWIRENKVFPLNHWKNLNFPPCFEDAYTECTVLFSLSKTQYPTYFSRLYFLYSSTHNQVVQDIHNKFMKKVGNPQNYLLGHVPIVHR